MRKLITLVAAVVLVVGGAMVATAQTDDTDPAPPLAGERHEILTGVLDDLVENGTIEQSQADAIVEALDAKRAEFEAAREERRAEFEAAREAAREAWSDGVLTQDEAEALPFGDRLTDPDGPFAEAWSDGQLTQEEVDELRPEFGFRRGPGGHHRGGLGFGPDGAPPVDSDTGLGA